MIIRKSPMMRRLNGSARTPDSPRLKFPFPKRVVIRLLLSGVLVFAGYRVIGSLSASANDTLLAHEKGALSHAQVAEETGGPHRVDRQFGAGFDAAKVEELCMLAPPRLKYLSDTIIAGKDSLIRLLSIDSMLQKTTATLFRQYRPKYAAAAIIHPKSGRVVALVSYCHDSIPVLSDRLYLRNILPAASIFKTVTAAAAIEKALYTDSTCLPVAGRNHTLYKFQLKREIDPWGEITFGNAYARSINPVFARIGMFVVGQQKLQEFTLRFGFNDRIPFDLPVDSSLAEIPVDTSFAMAEIASGFNRSTSLSVIHGALMASVAVNGGVMPRPSLIDSIVRPGGECVFRREPALWKTAVSAATAAQLRVLMDRVVDDGTAAKSFRALKRCAWSATIECGGKTGSINVDTLGKIDWFVGYAVDRDNADRSLAVSVATVHGKLWTVHSGYIAAEIIRTHFRPVKTGVSTRQLTIPVRADSSDTASPPGG